MRYYKRVPCQVCRTSMEHASETGYVPLEILVWLFENGYSERSVFHYLCPNRHQRAWYIPTLGERESVLIHKAFSYPA